MQVTAAFRLFYSLNISFGQLEPITSALPAPTFRSDEPDADMTRFSVTHPLLLFVFPLLYLFSSLSLPPRLLYQPTEFADSRIHTYIYIYIYLYIRGRVGTIVNNKSTTRRNSRKKRSHFVK